MNDSNSNQKNRTMRRKRPKWFRIVSFVLLILLAGAGLFFYNVYHNIANAVSKMNRPLSKSASTVNLKKLQPISILLLGDDHRAVGEPGSNTDTMIVVTINPKNHTTKMLSIPRDTRTKLVDYKDTSKDTVDKINAAFAYGGAEMAVDTVENFLNIPINYYIEVNFQGFQQIIDAVGGIEVNNQYPFELDGVTLNTGPYHLNGLQALEYARMRHQDPRGDFGRQERQQEVIAKVIKKGKSMSTIWNYNKLLQVLSKNITTNINLNDMVGMMSSYKPATKKIDHLQVEGQGATINYLWYLLVDDEERQKLSDQLRASLNLAPSPVVEFYKGTGVQNNYSTTPMTVSELNEQK